jgi:hypothetical protein
MATKANLIRNIYTALDKHLTLRETEVVVNAVFDAASSTGILYIYIYTFKLIVINHQKLILFSQMLSFLRAGSPTPASASSRYISF